METSPVKVHPKCFYSAVMQNLKLDYCNPFLSLHIHASVCICCFIETFLQCLFLLKSSYFHVSVDLVTSSKPLNLAESFDTASFSCCFVEMISNSHVDLTLSNARQFYSSMGAISGKRGSKIPADNLTHQTDQWLSLCPSLSCTMQDAWLSLVWFWLKRSFLPMDALSHSLTRRNEEIHFEEKLTLHTKSSKPSTANEFESASGG